VSGHHGSDLELAAYYQPTCPAFGDWFCFSILVHSSIFLANVVLDGAPEANSSYNDFAMAGALDVKFDNSSFILPKRAARMLGGAPLSAD